METARTWGCVALIVGAIGLFFYGIRMAPLQAADVYYRAWWILAHRSDLPPKANLCARPFCTRLDTKQKYAGGNPGHVSESTYPFCPEHETPNPVTTTKLDGLLRAVYFLLSAALSILLAMIVFFAAAFPPLLLGAAIARKTRKAQFAFETGLAISFLLSVLCSAGAWVLYVIY